MQYARELFQHFFPYPHYHTQLLPALIGILGTYFNIANPYNSVKMIRDFKGDISFYSTCVNHAVKRTPSSILVNPFVVAFRPFGQNKRVKIGEPSGFCNTETWFAKARAFLHDVIAKTTRLPSRSILRPLLITSEPLSGS
jgi:hypothetical protein